MRQSDSTSDEIRQLKAQLGMLRNKAALGELLGTTTHEFNNILMTIMNYAKMGIRHQDQATRDKALEKILAASERAAKITHSVLGMAKNRCADFAPVDLAKLLDETMILLTREFQQYRIQIEIQSEPDLPKAKAVGNQIQQVLLNLLTNARQAMSKGGSIMIRLFAVPDENRVALSVRDYGCGMTPDVMQQIFEPYFTTKAGPDASGKGGTGLGLSACKEVVEQHQGRIRVDSSVGKGTMFTILLPVYQTSEIPQLVDHSQTDASPLLSESPLASS